MLVKHGIFNVSRSFSSNVVATRRFSGLADSNNEKELQIFSKRRESHVSLKVLMETGKGERLSHYVGTSDTHHSTASEKILYQVACYLHRELPIRLAHQAVKLSDHQLLNQSRKCCLHFINS
jgi:hypothetical protein